MTIFSPLRYSVYIIAVVTLCIDLFLWEVNCDNSEVDGHLQMGVEQLARGQLQDALSHFHAAIDGDPKNYLSYYRRATVYLALGRSRASLNDLDEVLKMKPDFISARTQRASVLVKLGRLDEAYIDIEKVLMKEPSNELAGKLLQLMEPLKQKIHYARNYMDSGFYTEAIPIITDIIVECPWDAEMRELRISGYMAVGDVQEAIADLRAVTKLTQDNTNAYYRLSEMYYQIGDTDQSLMQIRECLKLDPDHQTCFMLYKTVKKVAKLVNSAHEYKNENDHNACAESSKKILKAEPHVLEIKFLAYDNLCQCEPKGGSLEQALAYCRDALLIREEPRLYCDRAEVYILQEKFDDALSDYQTALRLDETLQRAKEGIDRTQKLKKQASKKDYYKILGVSRNASKKEISKAYRSMAQKWHPDHFDGDEKKEAERRFIEIAAAKEVLTDAEKRAMFDNGQDPLDPEQQQGGFGGGFNPFENFRAFKQGGFHQGGGGGGPFNFKFQYN